MTNNLTDKKTPPGFWHYDKYRNLNVLLGNSGVYLYDSNYNQVDKIPLSYCHSVQFVDDDLAMFTFTSSRKIVFYSFLKKEVINTVVLRLKKDGCSLLYAEQSLYCKKQNSILVWAWFKSEQTKQEVEEYVHLQMTDPGNLAEWYPLFRQKYPEKHYHAVCAYNLDTKKYKEIYPVDTFGSPLCFAYDENYYFDRGDHLLVFDADLAYKKIPIEKKLPLEKYSLTDIFMLGHRFDEKNAVVVPYNISIAIDNSYYGKGDLDFCIDLNGKIRVWNPVETVEAKPEIYKKPKNKALSKVGNRIRKNDLTVEFLQNANDEEIFDNGFLWASDKLELAARDKGLKHYELMRDKNWLNENFLQPEFILYSVGFFCGELGNGGLEQYACNAERQEKLFFIKVLNAVGAVETAKIIEKTLKAGVDYESLNAEMTEEYVGLTVKYLKRSIEK
jgi:hypothetical protein